MAKLNRATTRKQAASGQVFDLRPRRRGASLVEFALILPLLLVLIANVVNFGGFFFAWITVENAARTGAQFLARGDKALGDPAPVAPTPESGKAGLTSPVVTQDVSSLRNNPSLALRVCTRNPSGRGSGTTPPTVTCTTVTGAFATIPSNPPEDPTAEAPCCETGWVDVAYTYQAFIPLGFTFPGLGFGPIWPNNPNGVVVHRQVVMRLL
jgi:Flp pilus assembly protein TadG